MDTLFVYVDGSDLEECHPVLAPQLEALAAAWAEKGCRFVDDRHTATVDLRPGDFPDWHLGLNLPLGQLGRAEAEQLVQAAKRLAAESGRGFVIGVGTDDGYSEDLLFVGAQAGHAEVAQLLRHVAGP